MSSGRVSDMGCILEAIFGILGFPLLSKRGKKPRTPPPPEGEAANPRKSGFRPAKKGRVSALARWKKSSREDREKRSRIIYSVPLVIALLLTLGVLFVFIVFALLAQKTGGSALDDVVLPGVGFLVIVWLFVYLIRRFTHPD